MTDEHPTQEDLDEREEAYASLLRLLRSGASREVLEGVEQSFRQDGVIE
jgi:hypothetical protein